MKSLVVGASGFLGGHVFRILRNTPYVRVSGTYGRNPVSSDLYPVNLACDQSVKSMMTTIEPDVVLWCAKHTADSSEQELNLIGLRTLLERAAPGMRLIFLSTDGLLPGTEGNYDETTVPAPINSDSGVAVYTNSKLEAEKFIASFWDNFSIVRVGPIYGKAISGIWDQRVSGLIDAFNREEGVLRATNIRRTFIHVEDLARALVELGQTDYRGIIHLGPTESANHFEFARTVCRVFGFEDQQVESYLMPDEEISSKAIRADTTLDTRMAARILRTPFRTVTQGMLDTYTHV